MTNRFSSPVSARKGSLIVWWKFCLLVAFVAVSIPNLRAQGTVGFQNSATTVVTNLLTMGLLGTDFLAQLYYAPDGETNKGRFVPISQPSRLFTPGRFAGGVCTTPTNTAPGEYALFLVRVWHPAYGSTWEMAVCFGNTLILGESGIVRMQTGIPGSSAPSLVSGGLHGFLTGLGGGLSTSGDLVNPTDALAMASTNELVTVVFRIRNHGQLEPSHFYDGCGPAVVAYQTVDGTAIAGRDYIPTNGVITFQPDDFQRGTNYGDWQYVAWKDVAVQVKPRMPGDPDRSFSLRLSSTTPRVVVQLDPYYGTGQCTIKAPPFRPFLTDVRRAGVGVSLSFQTLSNHVFRVERAFSLAPEAPWTSLDTNALPGTGESVTFTDAAVMPGTNRFYRVRMD